MIKSVQIISNNIGYGSVIDESEEVEQHLTLRADGRYWLSRYNYGGGDGLRRYRLFEKKQGQLFPKKQKPIFDKLTVFCSTETDTDIVTDCGEWSMRVTFDDNTTKEYYDSLCHENSILSEISQLIRVELDRFDLFLFDGNTDDPRYDIRPLSLFSKYLPLLYENTFLWNRFSHLCRSFFWDKRDDKHFFAFHRDPACIEIWLGMLDNMGGGIPLHFFSAAAFIILAYKEAGNNIDKELAECANK